MAKLVPDEATEFALTVFAEGKVEVGKVVSAAKSVGMFASQRVVLVRDVGVLDGEAGPLSEFAKRPPANAYLIVRAPQLDRRRKLHQVLDKEGTLLAFGALEDSRSEVAAMAKERGLALAREAVEFIALVCGGDLYRVASELDKLAVSAGGGGKPLGLAEVRESAAGSAALGMGAGRRAADPRQGRGAPRPAGSGRSG